MTRLVSVRLAVAGDPMRRRWILVAVAVLCSACSACAPGPAEPNTHADRSVGELEGLTPAQAAERVGVGASAIITPCGESCAAFSVAGCTTIRAQCNNPKNHNIALTEDAKYFTECPNALALACGEAVDLIQCFDKCRAAGK